MNVQVLLYQETISMACLCVCDREIRIVRSREWSPKVVFSQHRVKSVTIWILSYLTRSRGLGQRDDRIRALCLAALLSSITPPITTFP